ncbi:FG-GAP and VCBS repeat-containing protein [Paenibacillus thiaminolyticus]|uniref:FG-GAP and VCBS repeat-containing protein n=1 Tax=Paenibacillus thiaminolyticus TaxID=49283 RepID=A0AAP9DTB1_PANTH|nr:VCBS repeat-containing protein [Paenibacillus thiaminolyticus]MCY9538143.1 FG-GAP and VCBS repeat-containing protein [Paenibacillus thiaminolyticus]MCY9600944.1 FG-GAP and VCBS repeat-containing protein [Paenibacillus thiaminolyticus]MCY9609389.1 FG-GAP and VCBS repeat-containing protein [Paenibacillus thiaminolyticus]MCY9614629.1 FG-GAP and VCBS repeat-containing protein [Paenibacillus thiaminolyticus]MCY9617752.1 FG-GAP and VCBS repeat-containing protein [Paenibacillus thiaminolyticus]
MRDIRRWGVLAAASLLWIGGCSMPSAPADLVQPPRPEPHQRSGLVLSDLPGFSRLLIPALGEEGNGISVGDVDGDGNDEVVVVYEANIEDEKVQKAALLKREDEAWRVVWDTKGFGHGLDYAGLADLNQDGYPDIVLGWALGGGEKGMDVYVWKDDGIELWRKTAYRGQMSLGEMDDEIQ